MINLYDETVIFLAKHEKSIDDVVFVSGNGHEIQRPSCCAECIRYFRNNKKQGCGYCDEWAGILLHDGDVCHPNIGRKQKKEGGEE